MNRSQPSTSSRAENLLYKFTPLLSLKPCVICPFFLSSSSLKWSCCAGEFEMHGLASRLGFCTFRPMPDSPKRTALPLCSSLFLIEQWNVRPSNSIEIYDPKTQIWESVPCLLAEILGERVLLRSIAIDGKLYLFGDKSMVYKPMENKWDVVLGYETLSLWTQFKFTCVINNVIYSSILSKVLKWYDSDGRMWRDLKGLEELPKLPRSLSRLRLANYGGKIAVLWEKNSDVFSRKKMIWCAVIAVERRNEQEIYGTIEWCDVVLTVPKSCRVLEPITVTI